jgi:hypothetical protein
MADEWLQQGVDVDIQSLQDFAEAVRATLNDFNTSLGAGIMPLVTVQPRLGSVVKEGAYLRDSHGLQVQAMQAMLRDVTLGLNALAMAAEAIALEYMAGDALSQATLDDVRDAFSAILPTYPTSGEAGESTDEMPDEEEPLPEGEYSDTTEPPEPDGSGRTIAEGTPGEFRISSDDEGVYGDDVPAPPAKS